MLLGSCLYWLLIVGRGICRARRGGNGEALARIRHDIMKANRHGNTTRVYKRATPTTHAAGARIGVHRHRRIGNIITFPRTVSKKKFRMHRNGARFRRKSDRLQWGFSFFYGHSHMYSLNCSRTRPLGIVDGPTTGSVVDARAMHAAAQIRRQVA